MPRVYSEDLLNDMYGDMEFFAKYEVEHSDRTYLNRGDMITVDGKTIREIMAEEYARTDEEPDGFGRYYIAHVQEKTDELVRRALDNGQYVEMFRTDRYGAVVGEPEQLVASKKELEQPDREIEPKIVESREHVKYINGMRMHGIDRRVWLKEFFGGWMEDHPEVRVTDEHFYTAVLAMFAEGHTIDEITDPTKLAYEKKKIGREVMSSYAVHEDAEWLADKVVRGQQCLLDQLDEKLDNLKDINQLEKPEYRKLFLLAKCASGISEIYAKKEKSSSLKKELLKAAEKVDPEQPEGLVRKNQRRSHVLQFLFDKIQKEMYAKEHLSLGDKNKDERSYLLEQIIQGEHVKNVFDKIHSYSQPYSICIRETEIEQMDAEMRVIKSEEEDYERLADMMKSTPVSRAVGEKLFSGNVQDYLGISRENNGSVTVQIKPPLAEQFLPFEAPRLLKMEQDRFHKEYPAELAASIKALKDADPPLMFGSQQYKDIRKSADALDSALRKFKKHPYTYEQVHELQEKIGKLQKSIRYYAAYKKIKENRTGSDMEIKRLEAALKIERLGKKLMASIQKMDQCHGVIPELKDERQRVQGIAQERARNEEQAKREKMRPVFKEIQNCLEKRYGKDAPSVFHAKGSMQEVEVAEEGQPQKVNAIEQLNEDIMKHSSDLCTGAESRELTDNEKENLRQTMGKMIVVETIVMERMVAGKYKDGMEKVKPGRFETAYAKNPEKFLHTIMKTNAFKSMNNKLEDPAKCAQAVKDFITKKGAKTIAEAVQKEATKAHEKNKKEQHAANDIIDEIQEIKEEVRKREEKSKKKEVQRQAGL